MKRFKLVLKCTFLAVFIIPSINCFAIFRNPPKRFITLGYFGEKITHPGLNLSFESEFKFASESKKLVPLWGTAIQTYWHPQNHIGLRIAPCLELQKSVGTYWNLGIRGDAGFYYRFFSGDVYSVDQNGEVSKKQISGSSKFTYGLYINALKDTRFMNNSFSIGFNIGVFNVVNALDNQHQLHPVLSLDLIKKIKA